MPLLCYFSDAGVGKRPDPIYTASRDTFLICCQNFTHSVQYPITQKCVFGNMFLLTKTFYCNLRPGNLVTKIKHNVTIIQPKPILVIKLFNFIKTQWFL